MYTNKLRGWIYEAHIEVSSGAMTYILSFIKNGSGIQKLIQGGIYTDTKAARRSHKPVSFFLSMESRLKREIGTAVFSNFISFVFVYCKYKLYCRL
jgi:hypothetical protein